MKRRIISTSVYSGQQFVLEDGVWTPLESNRNNNIKTIQVRIPEIEFLLFRVYYEELNGSKLRITKDTYDHIFEKHKLEHRYINKELVDTFVYEFTTTKKGREYCEDFFEEFFRP